MRYSPKKSIRHGNKYFGILFPIIFLILILVSIFSSQGCESNVPSDSGIDTALVTQLRVEYSTYGASTIPPFNAFTDWEESGYYTFWDGYHITFGNGFALNTSDTNYSEIAILRYYAPNGKKAIDGMADVVTNNYYEIDTTATGPVPISSAYRNPRRNNEKDGGQNSYHIYGRAIDFDTDDTILQGQQIWDASLQTGWTELLNEPKKRTYRPYSGDDTPTTWIHVGW